MVVLNIWDSILIYIKNWLMSWSDDKELSSRADVVNSNSLSQKKNIYIYIYIPIKIIFRWFCYKKNVFPRKILPNIEAINEVHFIFGSCGHRVLWLSNLKVMSVCPIGKNEQTLNYWYLGNALVALLVLCCQKKNYTCKKYVI